MEVIGFITTFLSVQKIYACIEGFLSIFTVNVKLTKMIGNKVSTRLGAMELITGQGVEA